MTLLETLPTFCQLRPIRNNLQGNSNRNSILFIQLHAFEKFPADFSMGRFVNIFINKTDLIRLIRDAGQVLTLFKV